MPHRQRPYVKMLLVIAIPVLLLGAFTAGHVYRKEICPICGQSDSASGFQFLGTRLTGNRTEPGKCLASRHRWVHADGTRQFWWKKTYSHGRGVAAGWDRAHRLLVGPWLQTRGPSDPERIRVITALEQATVEQLDEFLSSFQILSRDGAGELLETPTRETLDRWAVVIVHPWTEEVLAGQSHR